MCAYSKYPTSHCWWNPKTVELTHSFLTHHLASLSKFNFLKFGNFANNTSLSHKAQIWDSRANYKPNKNIYIIYTILVKNPCLSSKFSGYYIYLLSEERGRLFFFFFSLYFMWLATFTTTHKKTNSHTWCVDTTQNFEFFWREHSRGGWKIRKC